MIKIIGTFDSLFVVVVSLVLISNL